MLEALKVPIDVRDLPQANSAQYESAMRLTYQGKLYDASSLSLTLFNCHLDNGSCAYKHPIPLSSMLVS